ncbi:hypothetical protein CB1_001533096 [Camelus ferus]|nr:hypothetical protein CB1_001533096 [Camelus ferus]
MTTTQQHDKRNSDSDSSSSSKLRGRFLGKPDEGNKHIPIDLGTGNSNMIIWATRNKQTIDAVETMYQGSWKGRGPVVISEGLLHEIQTQQDKQLGPGKESGAGSQLKSSTCQEGEVATWSDVVSSSLITKQTP